MAESNSIANNRSTLREFLSSLSTIRGDLSNITAPPFVLDTKSTVELPQFWAQHLEEFVAPARLTSSSNDDEDEVAGKRMLAVLKWWLSSLRGQQYAGRNPESGVKKPLNAVLGEVFVGWWEGEGVGAGKEGLGKTFLVSEQTSHHPPVTASRVWNDKWGVEAEGFTRQEITFSMTGGSVNIQQMGYALFKLRNVGRGAVAGGGGRDVNAQGEVYLIPLPNVRVKGVLSGTPYPELGGRYRIPSTSGWEAEVEFTGNGFLGFGGGDSGKHGFEAKVFRSGSSPNENKPIYTLEGNWDNSITVKDAHTDKVLEEISIPDLPSSPLQTMPLEEQDPYETRRVWQGVREALNRGDMHATSDAKGIVEQGQRDMRKEEERQKRQWQRLFFKDAGSDDVAEQLRKVIGDELDTKETVGVWKFDEVKWQELAEKRPWRDGLRPDNTKAGEEEPGKRTRRSNMPGEWENHAPSTAVASAGVVESQQASSLPAATINQRQPDEELANWVGKLTVKEQAAVEEYIRNQYSSGGSKPKKRRQPKESKESK